LTRVLDRMEPEWCVLALACSLPHSLFRTGRCLLSCCTLFIFGRDTFKTVGTNVPLKVTCPWSAPLKPLHNVRSLLMYDIRQQGERGYNIFGSGRTTMIAMLGILSRRTRTPGWLMILSSKRQRSSVYIFRGDVCCRRDKYQPNIRPLVVQGVGNEVRTTTLGITARLF
jgi:hypothetical protein